MSKSSISPKKPAQGAIKKVALSTTEQLGLREGQSLELLKALHILTTDGAINQDSRRKLKQVNHLLQFIEPLLARVQAAKGSVTLVDHGAGKSYLGFMLYDLFFKSTQDATSSKVVGVEVRDELVIRSRELAAQFGFSGMSFLNLSVADSSQALPEKIDVVTALHACDTATDDAIEFAISREAKHVVLVPCCQAEVASALKSSKASALQNNPLVELWRRPLHTREFGSQLTNVLRCLQLEAHGYEVTVTELVGWEHSMKNELIIASLRDNGAKTHAKASGQRLAAMLDQLGLNEMRPRFFTPLLEKEAA